MKILYKIRFIPLIIGITVIIVGFYYSVIKAGIPYQDPPPELLEKYMFYMSIGENLMSIGFSISIVSIILLIILKIVKSKLIRKM